MKFDIVRPAYLMAYQGMLRHLRDVIVYGTRPSSFNEFAWNAIIKELTLDNPDVKWDDNTFNSIRQGADKGRKPIILNMPDEARSKFLYWRELRNVCAHNKEYTFLKAHTLTLYAFLEDFLLRITVECGMQTLLKEFDDYYNPVLTAPSKPIEPLLAKITSMVKVEELKTFVEEIFKIRSKYHHYHGAEFLLSCYDSFDGAYKDELNLLIKSNELTVEAILEHDPKRVLDFATTPEEIRKIIIRDSFCLIKGCEIVAHLLEAGKKRKSILIKYSADYISTIIHGMKRNS